MRFGPGPAILAVILSSCRGAGARADRLSGEVDWRWTTSLRR